MSGIIVIGAGMAGLLAAGMLRTDCAAVFEAQPSLPNNHSAVLRFRSNVVGSVLNIPFKQVSVLKSVASWRNPVADALAYSKKTNGSLRLRSILTASGDVQTRYIAPDNLLALMEARVQAPISYDNPLTVDMIEHSRSPIISTIPMPALMKILGWEPKGKFDHRPGYNVRFRFPGLDAYVSLYVPNPGLRMARLSVTGDEVVAECYGSSGINDPDPMSVMTEAMDLLGIYSDFMSSDDQVQGYVASSLACTRQQYGKILPYDEQDRQKFVMWATEQHGIFSLGRFATWRPGLLMDDVVRDVNIISNMIRNGRYSALKEKYGNV